MQSRQGTTDSSKNRAMRTFLAMGRLAVETPLVSMWPQPLEGPSIRRVEQVSESRLLELRRARQRHPRCRELNSCCRETQAKGDAMTLTLLKGYPDSVGRRKIFCAAVTGPKPYVNSGTFSTSG